MTVEGIAPHDIPPNVLAFRCANKVVCKTNALEKSEYT